MTVAVVACLACWGMFGTSGQTAAIAAAPLRGHGAVMQSHSSRVVIGQDDDLRALVAEFLSADDQKNVPMPRNSQSEFGPATVNVATKC